MKHTPGPWKAAPHDQVLDANDLVIADLAERNETQANVTLIAAAPTYYAIVEAILTDETLTAEHIRNMLRPVQAKAKGE